MRVYVVNEDTLPVCVTTSRERAKDYAIMIVSELFRLRPYAMIYGFLPDEWHGFNNFIDNFFAQSFFNKAYIENGIGFSGEVSISITECYVEELG